MYKLWKYIRGENWNYEEFDSPEELLSRLQQGEIYGDFFITKDLELSIKEV